MEYDNRQKFEHELIHRRITWLLSTQSLLFAGAAIAIEKQPFVIIISLVGIIISIFIFIGVISGIKAKRQNYLDELGKQQNENKSSYESNPLQWGVRTDITEKAMFTDQALPIVFALAWGAILLWQLLEPSNSQ